MTKPIAPTLSATEHRDIASQHAADAAESFARCDTDGFLSQWASDINSRLQSQLAAIADNGGTAEFDALFDIAGNLVPAKPIETAYGYRWAIFASAADASARHGGHIIQWLPYPYTDRQRANLVKRGYRMGIVRARAGAAITGSGRGLSGAASCSVHTYRLDNGFDPNAEIIDNGCPD